METMQLTFAVSMIGLLTCGWGCLFAPLILLVPLAAVSDIMRPPCCVCDTPTRAKR